MKKDLLKIIKISLIIFISLVAVYFISDIFFQPKIETDCSKIDSLLGFKFDACYDYNTKSVIFSVAKYSNNKVNSAVKINFDNQEFSIKKIPEFGKRESYKYSMDKNPINLTVTQLLREADNICTDSKNIPLQPCTEEQIEPGIVFNSEGKTNITINNTNISGDSISAIDKRKLFNITCLSEWNCEEWGDCLEGIQRRTCRDRNNCLYSTNLPELEKKCNACKEDWQCSWSECENNISTPTCRDRNNCGTEFSLSRQSKCVENQCTPDYKCSTWSECRADYTLVSLNNLKNISGIKTRICEDLSGCIKNTIETEQCSIETSIYSKNVIICGKDYIEIYSSSTDKLLARIKNDISGNLPNIDVSLSSNEVICNTCIDGIKNNGETGIDCGGTCAKCKKQAYNKDYLSDFLDWIRSFL